MDAPLEEGAAACLARVVAPASRPLALHRIDVNETQLTQLARSHDRLQRQGQRLVAIVLRHEYATPRLELRCAHLVEVASPQEGWLLDDHVLAAAQRAQSQLKMRCGRRCDKGGVDPAVGESGFVTAVGSGPAQPAFVARGPLGGAAGVE